MSKRIGLGRLIAAAATLLAVSALPAVASAQGDAPPPGCSQDPATGALDCPPGGLEAGPLGQDDTNDTAGDDASGSGGARDEGSASAASAGSDSPSGSSGETGTGTGQRVVLARTGFELWIMMLTGLISAAAGVAMLGRQRHCHG